ncbi:TPA: hypothetical protein ACH3X2_002084 [Trebouxia sp. C0005]
MASSYKWCQVDAVQLLKAPRMMPKCVGINNTYAIQGQQNTAVLEGLSACSATSTISLAHLLPTWSYCANRSDRACLQQKRVCHLTDNINSAANALVHMSA